MPWFWYNLAQCRIPDIVNIAINQFNTVVMPIIPKFVWTFSVILINIPAMFFV